jgi:D-threo-aldose 1-dehydrogenase
MLTQPEGIDPNGSCRSASAVTSIRRQTSVTVQANGTDPFQKHRVCATPLFLPRFGMGGASLGDMHASIPEAQAEATIEAAHAAGISYFDTSPWYGNTKSELRLGHVLRTKPRDSFVLSTKVGRVHRRPTDPDSYRHPAWAGGLRFEPHFDYSRGGVLKSYEMSLARLGLARVDALLIHDLDPGHLGTGDGVDNAFGQLELGGFEALAELKARREISAIGAGINRTGMIGRFLARFPVDFFLVAMPYTLLDQSGLEELDLCRDRGISVVIGAPFASGILVRGSRGDATYGYRSAPPAILAKVRGLEGVCARHNVPLAAAALRFLFGHPSVISVIPGPNAPEQVRQNLDWMKHPIPGALWADLRQEGLLDPKAPTPD